MKTKRLRTAGIFAISGLCLANMGVAIFPTDAGLGKYLDERLGGIRRTTGTVQRWGMFHTIPTLHRVSFRIMAKGKDGVEREYGPVLPGLRKVEAREEIRYHYTLLKIFGVNQEYLPPYVRAVAAELRAADPGLEEFSIRLEFEYTRHLFHIRKDGEMTVSMPEMLGPYRIEDA